MKTPKLPILCFLDQPFAHSVTFDIPADTIKRRFSLYWDCSESTLIDRAASTSAVCNVPSEGVSACHPVQPLGNIFDPIAKNDEVPMIWHDTIDNYSHLISSDSFSNDG